MSLGDSDSHHILPAQSTRVLIRIDDALTRRTGPGRFRTPLQGASGIAGVLPGDDEMVPPLADGVVGPACDVERSQRSAFGRLRGNTMECHEACFWAARKRDDGMVRSLED
jgi:hypothetical protein